MLFHIVHTYIKFFTFWKIQAAQTFVAFLLHQCVQLNSIIVNIFRFLTFAPEISSQLLNTLLHTSPEPNPRCDVIANIFGLQTSERASAFFIAEKCWLLMQESLLRSSITFLGFVTIWRQWAVNNLMSCSHLPILGEQCVHYNLLKFTWYRVAWLRFLQWRHNEFNDV